MDEDFSYFIKQTKPLFSELSWNFPEQKQGSVTVIGGNSQNFSLVSRIMTGLSRDFPINEVRAVLPDSLKSKIPFAPQISFVPSTESGSFAKSSELSCALNSSNFNFVIGDMSKNSETSVAISLALKNSTKPCLITRDAIDLIGFEISDILVREDTIIFGSIAQLQKVFRSVYYPKMIMLSMPLLSVVSILHKFTLSYPATIVTLHEGHILVAKDGKIVGTKLMQTNYSPISIWDGRLASTIVAFNLFNPKKRLEASSAAIFAD